MRRDIRKNFVVNEMEADMLKTLASDWQVTESEVLRSLLRDAYASRNEPNNTKVVFLPLDAQPEARSEAFEILDCYFNLARRDACDAGVAQ